MEVGPAQLRSVIPEAFSNSLDFVEHIRLQLEGAEYEPINERKAKSTPSVFLSFDGPRVISFDLQKRGGVRVYFWLKQHLTADFEREFGISTEKHTGWKAFGFKGPGDPDYARKLDGIRRYWNRCRGWIEAGEVQPLWKREERIKEVARRAWPDEPMIFNKKVIPGSTLVPDIYLPGRRLIIEVDGAQHYRQTGHFHGSAADFDNQRERDDRKHRECAEAGIAVLRIVEEAADFVTEDTLPALADRCLRDGGVWYLVREGDGLAMRSELT